MRMIIIYSNRWHGTREQRMAIRCSEESAWRCIRLTTLKKGGTRKPALSNIILRGLEMKSAILTMTLLVSYQLHAADVDSVSLTRSVPFSDEIGTQYVEREMKIASSSTGAQSVVTNLLKLSNGNLLYRLEDQSSETIEFHRQICERRGYKLPKLDSSISYTEDTIFAFSCERDHQSNTAARSSVEKDRPAPRWHQPCNTQTYVSPPGVVLAGDLEVYEAGAWFETGTWSGPSQGNLWGMIGSHCGFSRTAYVPGRGGGMDVFVIRACRFGTPGRYAMNSASEICKARASDYRHFIVQ